jgi:transposase
MPRKYDLEFKINAVRLVIEQGLAVNKVADDLGVGLSTLERWVTEHKQHGEAAFPGKGRLLPENDRLRRLERENEILRRERDILKKALAIFSSQ